MSDEYQSNQTVRENRAKLASTALEAGVSPLKAAEFGSRVSDQIKEVINAPLDPVADKGLVNAGAMVNATLRNADNRELSDVMITAGPNGKINNTSFADDKNMTALIREAVEGVNKMSVENIKNYAHAVEPMVTEKVANEVASKGR